MAPPALVKLSGKHLLYQQDQASWGVSVYGETSYSPTSCVLNSSNSSDSKGISLDLQLCISEENQSPERRKERPPRISLGEVRKYRQGRVGFSFSIFFLPPPFFFPNKYLFTFYDFFYYCLSTIHSTFSSHVLKIYLFLIFLALAYKNF